MSNFRATRFVLARIAFALLFSPVVNADNVEDAVTRHMVAEALLTAHFVAVAEQSGMHPTRSTRFFARSPNNPRSMSSGLRIRTAARI